MQFVDPLKLKFRLSKTRLIFSASQFQGFRGGQQDYFANFNDECFVIADGVGNMPHGKEASELAAETAVWGYKHIRLRRTYWQDKKLFLKHIFRSANLAVWQKRKEPGFEEGLFTTLLVAIVGVQNAWIGNVGDSSAWLYRSGQLRKLTIDDANSQGQLTKVIGSQRLGVFPSYSVEKFLSNDILLLVTDGVSNYMNTRDFETILKSCGDTSRSLSEAVVDIIDLVRQRGGRDNMTVSLVKRLPLI